MEAYSGIKRECLRMPVRLHVDDDRNDENNERADWREPPGRLGEYVRRVKRLQSNGDDLSDAQNTV
jgi:hypothetical protein